MRILVTCVSGYSHFHSMVPIAKAALERGHEVIFGTAQEMSVLAESAGFGLLSCGPSRLRIRTELQRLTGGCNDSSRRPGSDLAADPGVLFGDLVPRLRWKPLVDVIDRFQPDVLLCEALDLAGPLAAKLAAVPYFIQSIGPYHAETTAELRTSVEPLYRQRIGTTPSTADIIEPYIDICPPMLQSHAAKGFRGTLPVRLPTYHGSHDVAGEAPTADDGRPRLLITFGTIANDVLDQYGGIAAQLAAEGWLVTMTLGPRGWFDWTSSQRAGTAAGPQLTDGVRMIEYTPLDAELPRTAVLIHHGGSNTLRAAIEHAVPALVIPQSTEQRRNSQWVADQGLGLLVEPAEVSPARIASLSRQLIADEEIRARLLTARSAWLAMPSGSDLIRTIEARVGNEGGIS